MPKVKESDDEHKHLNLFITRRKFVEHRQFVVRDLIRSFKSRDYIIQLRNLNLSRSKLPFDTSTQSSESNQNFSSQGRARSYEHSDFPQAGSPTSKHFVKQFRDVTNVSCCDFPINSFDSQYLQLRNSVKHLREH